LTLAIPNTGWARKRSGHTREEAAFLKWAHAGENNEKDGWYLAATSTETKESYCTTFTASIGCSAKYLLTGRRGLPPLRELIAVYDPQLAIYAIGASDIIRKTPVDEYSEQVERAIDLLEKMERCRFFQLWRHFESGTRRCCKQIRRSGNWPNKKTPSAGYLHGDGEQKQRYL
jgi:hypothetical protein